MMSLSRPAGIAGPLEARPPRVLAERPRAQGMRRLHSLEAEDCGCWARLGRLLFWATRNNG